MRFHKYKLSKKTRASSPEARNRSITDLLSWAASGLCVLSRYATNTDDGYTSTPDQDQRKREDQPDLRRDVFLQVSLMRSRIGDTRRTHMSAGVETLCTISSVEEERFVLLDLRELVSQTLDLPTSSQPDPGDRSRSRTYLGWRYQRWKSCNFGQHPNGTHLASAQCG